MNPDAFNMSIRKFLKMVGVQSQREIEGAPGALEVHGRLTEPDHSRLGDDILNRRRLGQRQFFRPRAA